MQERNFTQLVPRPEVYKDGPAPSWLARRQRAISPKDVRRIFAGRTAPGEDWPARAAVLVPIVADDDGCRVLLIRRSPALSSDPLHVAFPGGHLEGGETSVEAALRETEEEIGLSRDRVEVLGCLEIAERRRDGERVVPVIGLVTRPFELELNDTEVEALLDIPLSVLLGKGCGWSESWTIGTADRIVHFFADQSVLGNDLIWGLTARILWDVLELLTKGL